jgi:hypothetical protein
MQKGRFVHAFHPKIKFIKNDENLFSENLKVFWVDGWLNYCTM